MEIAPTQPGRLKSRRHRQNPPPWVEDKFHTFLIETRDTFTQLYIHFTWATWDRLPLITPDIQQVIYATIIAECQKLGCTVIAVGSIEDRVHLLTGFPTTLAVFEIIKQVKGSSSHLMTHEIKPGVFFNGKAATEHLPLAMMRSTL